MFQLGQGSNNYIGTDNYIVPAWPMFHLSGSWPELLNWNSIFFTCCTYSTFYSTSTVLSTLLPSCLFLPTLLSTLLLLYFLNVRSGAKCVFCESTIFNLCVLVSAPSILYQLLASWEPCARPRNGCAIA